VRTQLIAFTLLTIWAFVVVIKTDETRGPGMLAILSFHKTKADCQAKQRKNRQYKVLYEFTSCEVYTVTERDRFRDDEDEY